MFFELSKTDTKTKARAGKITTSHGEITTPIFMPVGTVGSVKGVHQRELNNDINAQIILGNTYHLYLRPGLDVIESAGGLHKFMNWEKPILTDSGGYQGFSDIMMAFDECTTYPCDYNFAEKSMQLTHKWLDRGYKYFQNTEPKYGNKQTFFPIVQGSTSIDLRKKSAETIASYNAEGNAIGGLSVGEPAEKMYEMIEVVNNILPHDKPRYLMGVGTPANILEGISLGIDMFDCVMPTRNGRNGMLFTKNGIINIKNEKWKKDFSPLEDEPITYVDSQYSKAYLRHLMVSNELLALTIASIHNLGFYLWLVSEARNKILEGTFSEWKNNMMIKVTNRL